MIFSASSPRLCGSGQILKINAIALIDRLRIGEGTRPVSANYHHGRLEMAAPAFRSSLNAPAAASAISVPMANQA